MKAIGSNTNVYYVYVRGMAKPIRMDAVKGQKLSDYLTSDNTSAFVHITDTDGDERTIRVTTIDRVEKAKAMNAVYKTFDELKLPQLVSDDYKERVWK